MSTEDKLNIVAPTGGYYPEDDMPKYVEKLLADNIQPERQPRTDIPIGSIVIVLEGEFMAKKAIYLGRTTDFEAICVGIREYNEVPLFKIDEKFILKTESKFDIKEYDFINEDIYTSKKEYTELFNKELQATELEREITESIIGKVKEVKFMRSYLSENFHISTEENPFTITY